MKENRRVNPACEGAKRARLPYHVISPCFVLDLCMSDLLDCDLVFVFWILPYWFWHLDYWIPVLWPLNYFLTTCFVTAFLTGLNLAGVPGRACPGKASVVYMGRQSSGWTCHWTVTPNIGFLTKKNYCIFNILTNPSFVTGALSKHLCFMRIFAGFLLARIQ